MTKFWMRADEYAAVEVTADSSAALRNGRQKKGQRQQQITAG
jgi:hypothetical protein